MSCSFEAAFSTAPKENNKPKDTPAVRSPRLSMQKVLFCALFLLSWVLACMSSSIVV